jgi:ketosteroid isomerase-like protein
MSRENVELARRAYGHLQRNDIEGFLRYVDPDAEWHSLVLEIEGTFHGHEGVREWWGNLRDVFPDWWPTLQEVRDLDDWVLMHARATASGAGSSIGIDQDFWQVGKIRQGCIVYYAAFRTEREALKAAGLSE